MNVHEYIESGILTEYCFGMLHKNEAVVVEQNALRYPEIKKELDANLHALAQYASARRPSPPPWLKEKILTLIENLDKEEKGLLTDLPLINRFSNHENWLKTIKPLLPPATNEDIYIKVLRNSDGVFQAVLWLKDVYPDEVHDKVQESALVLEGECTCYIGDEEIALRAGGFLQIPLNTHHNILVTNGPVLAVIQRLKVA